MLIDICLKLSSFLLDLEEVFGLQLPVFRQVCAVDSITASIYAKFSSDSVRTQILGYFWVHGTAQFTERLNCILLSDLHGDARSSSHLLYHWYELWQHT